MKMFRRVRAMIAFSYAMGHLVCITFPGFLMGAIISALTCRGNAVVFRNRFSWWTTMHGAFMFILMQRLLGVRGRFHSPLEIPHTHSFIVIANHQSVIDIPLVCYILWMMDRTALRWVLKEDLRWTPFGMAGMLTHCAFVIRKKETSEQDRASVAKCGDDALKDGASVILFPEGTRFKGAEPESGFSCLRRPKQGGFKELLHQMPGVGVLAITLRWDGGERGQGFGRTIWDTLDFVGRDLDVSVEYVSRTEVDADPDWMNNQWRTMDVALSHQEGDATT